MGVCWWIRPDKMWIRETWIDNITRNRRMQSTCQQQQAQQPGNATRTSFLIEDILSRGTMAPNSQHLQLVQQHHQLAPSQQHQEYQQFAGLLPGYYRSPPALLFPFFGTTNMGVSVVPSVTDLAALKSCRRRKARTVSKDKHLRFNIYLSQQTNFFVSYNQFFNWMKMKLNFFYSVNFFANKLINLIFPKKIENSLLYDICWV